MIRSLVCRMKPYIQPFERSLALAELRTLTGQEPQFGPDTSGQDTDYVVTTDFPLSHLTQNLAYWESIQQDQRIFTTQALREATINVVRNGAAIEQIEWLVNLNLSSSLPNRRSLRYGPHGLHEYRGKFFPQLVRSLINIADVPANGVVADPMSGSGTTAVEAVLSERCAIGLDMNPLSVLIGRTKCALLAAKPAEIIAAYERIYEQLTALSPPPSLAYFESLNVEDQDYLKNWFDEAVLYDLDRIMRAVLGSSASLPVQNLMRVALSNIIRKVSWQRDDDLRVRKEAQHNTDIKPIDVFLEDLQRSTKAILALLYYNDGGPLGTFDIQSGNACAIPHHWQEWGGKVDVVITSPPYATALPYLDTDRLSLFYLGLLSRRGQRERDQDMIGNREVTDKKRKEYWQTFSENKEALPPAVTTLIERIDRLNATKEVGFRRKNLPALLAKYFIDMKAVLNGIDYVLKPGAPAFVVVGSNHTIAGDEKVDIETGPLLVEIARSIGLEVGEHIPMEMLVSRDIFKKNAGASETILCFRRAKDS